MRDRSQQVGGDHYTTMAIQPFDVIDTWPTEQRIGAYRSMVLKYVMRAGAKGNAVEDYRKAADCAQKLVEAAGQKPRELTPGERAALVAEYQAKFGGEGPWSG